MAQPPICLAVGGLDPSGGAGVVADIETFSTFGCRSAAAITSVTLQNGKEFFGAVHQEAAWVLRQIECVLDDEPEVTVKTGMLPTRDIVAALAAVCGEHPIVVDPVIRSTSGRELMDKEALDTLIKLLLPMAHIVTPNIPEAEAMTGMTIRTADDIERAASFMHSMGAQNVLIKGGHRLEETEQATDYLSGVDGARWFSVDLIPGGNARGTGCRLASAIAANLALGEPLDAAVSTAKEFVQRYIARSTSAEAGRSF